ncbi:MAG: ABC transporter substrate-binding protein [Alphaproteobacteria bacterium]|nr:ABC transporter substrate-binding protein [Alphaproteobacteria bacterium]
MTERREHYYIKTLKQQFAEGRVDRREFLRTATLLGITSTAAYAFVGQVTGQNMVRSARAQDIPMGGTLRVAQRTIDIKDPHIFSWVTDSNICRGTIEYLTRTGTDNVTRPWLVESWEASDDLKTWTLHVRKGVTWRSGRDFTADDVIWNIKHCLDDATGSSVQGLMKGYMLTEYDTGEVDESGSPKLATKLWDANAIERVDDFTVRLNAQAAQLAVPEHFFHYPFMIVDPDGGGKYGIGGNGTGAFELKEMEVGKRALAVKVRDHWSGKGPYIDAYEILDPGDDPSARIGMLASRQVHLVDDADILQLPAFQNMEHVEIHTANTAQTAVARIRRGMSALGDDPRVNKALRMAIDSSAILGLAHANVGAPGEHHHVAQIHPEYAKLPEWKRDVDGAKALLAEAGYPDGVDLELSCKPDPAWELAAVQAMVEQWKDANIRVAINVLPSAQYWEVWDKAPFAFTGWTHRPLGVMVLGLAYRSGVPWNESNFSNAKFDELLTKAEGILDVDQRREVMAEIETLMQEEGPIIQPVWRAVYTPVDKSVVGFETHPTGYYFWDEYGVTA